MIPAASITTRPPRCRRRWRCSPGTAKGQGPLRGQSLLPLLKLRLGHAEHLVDIGRIPGLEYVKEEAACSASAPHARIRAGAVRADPRRYPILYTRCGSSRTRWCATSRRWAEPRARRSRQRPSGTMLALGAQVVAVGPSGERVIPSTSSSSASSPPRCSRTRSSPRSAFPPAPRSGGAYVKLERKSRTTPPAAAAQVTLAHGAFDRVAWR